VAAATAKEDTAAANAAADSTATASAVAGLAAAAMEGATATKVRAEVETVDTRNAFISETTYKGRCLCLTPHRHSTDCV